MEPSGFSSAVVAVRDVIHVCSDEVWAISDSGKGGKGVSGAWNKCLHSSAVKGFI